MKKYQAALAAVWAASTAFGCQGSVTSELSREASGGEDGTTSSDKWPVKVDPPAACLNAGKAGAGTWRRLTAEQYQATVRDLLGVTPDTKSFLLDTSTGPFATNAPLPAQDGDIDNYATSAEAIAKQAVAGLDRLVACDRKAKGDDTCAKAFIKDFGARAYRRPLTADEAAGLEKVYAAGKEESFAEGIELVVQAALQAPSFLYLVEHGEEDERGLRKLTGYEIASRLSYTLTGTMPDAKLMEAAESGKLASAGGIQKAAEDLLDSDKFLQNAARFHVQLLGLNALLRPGVVTKEASKYPDFNDAMRAALVEEPAKFVNYVMTEGTGTIEELLTAPYVFPHGPLQQIYGDDVSEDGGRVEIKDGSRAGLLGLAGFQASHPLVPTHYGAVIRGHAIRKELLCTPVPPPLQAVKFETPPNADKMTPQELLREHQENPTCKGCHELMDPIGFGFEKYDLLGRIKDRGADGNSIDVSGEVTGLESGGKFADTQELTTTLATAPEVRKCLGTQWFRFALAREPQPEDACAEATVQETLAAGKGDVRSAVLSLVTSDAFRFRRGE